MPDQMGGGLPGDPLEGTAYRTLRPLGGGATCEVLLAEHRSLGLPCVVRVLRARLAGDPQRVDALRLEAQTLGRLGHPHIAAVKGAGTTVDGRPFIVHELLEGSTLAEELAARGGRLPVLEALTYESQLLSALSAAHEVGIVDANLDPKNLFVCRGPEGQPWIKIVDFGSTRMSPNAREARSRASEPLTARRARGSLTLFFLAALAASAGVVLALRAFLAR